MSGAQIIDGRALAGRIREETAARVADLGERGIHVRLDAILVGDADEAAIYAESQAKRCSALGIDHHLHALDSSLTDGQLQEFIQGLSRDPEVTGVMLNLPLPDHLDTPAAQYAIDPYKDIEGVNPANIGLMFYGTPIIAPCTALAVMKILREVRFDVRGKTVAVIGQGDIVGKPITLALMREEATVITANKYTPNLAARTRAADVVIAAAGVAEMVGPEHVRDGAVVIDVGINCRRADPSRGVSGGVVGDVQFEAVREIASVITPVPGGVGPITVAILLHSTVEAAAKQLDARRIR
jgi:methylenetetrahydrofolate dehydrogenase (NADP+)/methenyltetrahydrofolate cyclohydrolase